jgi:hypothetical protein
MAYVTGYTRFCRETHKKKPGDYRLAIALTSKKMVNLRPLVTHRYAVKVRA